MANPILLLRDEIVNDPLLVGYSGMSSAQVAGKLNEKNRTFMRVLDSAELLAWAAQNERLYHVTRAAEQGVDRSGAALPPAVASIAMAAHRMLLRDNARLDLNLPDRVAMVDALVAGNVLTAADKTDLMTLATVTGSRAEELGIVELGEQVVAGHVDQARALAGI